MPLLSVIIPSYNEARTLPLILQKIVQTPLTNGYEWELIIVDDGSTDETPAIVREWEQRGLNITGLRHEQNCGKGHAIRTGLQHVTGTHTIIQDADMEYDPADIVRLLEYALQHDCPVVYGSRILGQRLNHHKQTASPVFYWGGRTVTWVTNLLYGLHLTDEPTCYKLFETSLIKSLPLRCERFEFCPEVTALVARRGYDIPEIAISYAPRSIADGKKINWRDGLEAIWTLLQHAVAPSPDATHCEALPRSGA